MQYRGGETAIFTVVHQKLSYNITFFLRYCVNWADTVAFFGVIKRKID